MSWHLTASRQFSVKLLYAKLTKGPALDVARWLWKANLPLEVKIFLWQMFRNHLRISGNVAKRNGPSDGNCVVCSVPEDTNHVFFRCPLARFAWSVVRDASGASWNPGSGTKLLAILNSLRGSAKRILWHCVGALMWAIWHIRNKITIEAVFPLTQLTIFSNVSFSCSNVSHWGSAGILRKCNR